jgi:poly-gamma-glutamate synthesis protein (capsule biosynthesis protein)
MAIDLIFTGDLVLDEPRPEHWLSGIAPVTRAADVTIGHLEVPHTARGTELKGDVPAPGADPQHLAALAQAGFDALTLAGNHIADCGAVGIADTRAELERLGIACCGADANLDLARRAAVIRVAGRSLALLSYNCVGPENSWATPQRAGCAYVRINTPDGGPISPAADLRVPDVQSVAAMQADIRDAVRDHDLVVVALHKGLVHTPAQLAPYERAVAHAAIDAGAHVVIGHHAHIVRGIEFHRGRPIFHGLGNGCVVTGALSPSQEHPERAAWARKRRELFGFEPDPAYSLAPFHPQAVNAMLGRIQWHADGRIDAGIVPVHVEPPGRPVVAGGAQATAIVDYISRITLAAGLPAVTFEAMGDWFRAA